MKNSLESSSLKDIVYCILALKKKHNTKKQGSGKIAYIVAKIKMLLQKVFLPANRH